MEKSVLIKGDNYDISGIFSYTETVDKMPAVILCHGTGAQKNEVGDLFVILAEKLLQRGIASVRIDYAGCGDSKADQRELTFLGEVEDTRKHISISAIWVVLIRKISESLASVRERVLWQNY